MPVRRVFISPAAVNLIHWDPTRRLVGDNRVGSHRGQAYVRYRDAISILPFRRNGPAEPDPALDDSVCSLDDGVVGSFVPLLFFGSAIDGFGWWS